MFDLNHDATHFLLPDGKKLPATWPTGLALRERSRGTPAAESYCAALWERVDHSHALSKARDYPAADLYYEYASRLRAYQRADAAWLAYTRRGLLWADPGLGKTASALAALAHAGVLNNALVLCPASVISVWQNEITTWAPHLTTSNAATISPDETTANITLASYSIAKLRKTVIGHAWDAIILDECHALKNRKSQQSKYVRQLAKRNPKAMLAALSGTPYSNNVSDIWPVLHCIDPAGFPSFQRFVNLYCDTVQGPYSVEVTGISANAEREFELATRPYIRRVAKADVAADLPPKRYQVVEVALSDDQRKAYDETSAELATLAQSGETVTAANALTQLTRLLQYCTATPTGIDAGTGRLQLAAPSTKIDALVELARQRKAEPIVVFCINVDVAELAAHALTADGRNVGVLSGQRAPAVRGATVKAFQAGELDAVVATLAVGGQGITLTRARTAIFLQRSWSFVESVQAEDRIHRLSSAHHESVEIIDIVAAGTVETEKLLPVVRGKYKLVADILSQYTKKQV